MASAAAATADQGEAAPPKKGGKKKLILILVPVLLIGAGAGLWFSGILPGLLGMNPPPEQTEAAAAEQPMPPPRPPSFLEMPDITANLNVAPGRRASFIRIRSKLELGRPEDAAILQAAMPRLLDLFQTYLREMRPEELRGSVGTHRLREELIARANLVAPPARVADVLFVEILIQ
jgi:flagellar protein FliL